MNATPFANIVTTNSRQLMLQASIYMNVVTRSDPMPALATVPKIIS